MLSFRQLLIMAFELLLRGLGSWVLCQAISYIGIVVVGAGIIPGISSLGMDVKIGPVKIVVGFTSSYSLIDTFIVMTTMTQLFPLHYSTEKNENEEKKVKKAQLNRWLIQLLNNQRSAQNQLAAGTPYVVMRRNADNTRENMRRMKPTFESMPLDDELISIMNQIVDVCERTIELCSPAPAA